MKTLLVTFFPNIPSKLVLTKLDYTWTAAKKEIIVQIKNIGNQDSGPFSINFELEKEAISEPPEPQISHTIKQLKKNDSITYKADFSSFAQPNNEYLANINKLIIYVEGKSKEDIPIISMDNKNSNMGVNKKSL